MEKTQLTRKEWNDALRVPTPHRNKKKYRRKEKHRAAWKSGSSVVYLRVIKNKGYVTLIKSRVPRVLL